MTDMSAYTHYLSNEFGTSKRLDEDLGRFNNKITQLSKLNNGDKNEKTALKALRAFIKAFDRTEKETNNMAFAFQPLEKGRIFIREGKNVEKQLQIIVKALGSIEKSIEKVF